MLSNIKLNKTNKLNNFLRNYQSGLKEVRECKKNIITFNNHNNNNITTI